jgi:hypothetical protein
VVSEPDFRNPPLQVMEDCLDQSVGDLVHELQRTVKNTIIKMELHKLQRMVEECRRKMGESSGRFESTSTEIKSEIRCEQQQTMLALHFVQKPHTPHHFHNVKTQPLCSQIRHPIKPSLPSRKSIDPSLRSRKCRMQHFKCAANYHADCQPTAKPWSAQHQISTHVNFVSEYRGVKAKNEGVFNWLIRKKRKKKKKRESIFLRP